MALKIRLARYGAKKRPFYRIVVADSRAPRDGRFIDRVGIYNPMVPKHSEERVRLDIEKCKDWLAKGARPTERVARFLGEAGLWDWKSGHNPVKGKPGAKAEQRITERKEREQARFEVEEKAKVTVSVEADEAVSAAADVPAEDTPDAAASIEK